MRTISHSGEQVLPKSTKNVTHHNIINANKVIINYGTKDKYQTSQSSNRRMRQSRDGAASQNTNDAVLNQITNDKNFIDSLNSQIGTDEEVMFVGKKVNNIRQKVVQAQRKVNRSMPNRGKIQQ